jgi:hypothetical protein
LSIVGEYLGFLGALVELKDFQSDIFGILRINPSKNWGFFRIFREFFRIFGETRFATRFHRYFYMKI